MTRPTLGSAKESPSWLGRPAPALRGCAQIELYSLRWQIELFFKELKSTLGFAQYSFQNWLSAIRVDKPHQPERASVRFSEKSLTGR